VRRWICNGVKLRAVRALADGNFHCVAQDELVSFDTESGKCLGSAGGEILVPTGNESHPNWLIDIISLTVTGGQSRTEAEFRNLFDEVGFDAGACCSTALLTSSSKRAHDRLGSIASV
jgi:hypothetical protein